MNLNIFFLSVWWSLHGLHTVLVWFLFHGREYFFLQLQRQGKIVLPRKWSSAVRIFDIFFWKKAQERLLPLGWLPSIDVEKLSVRRHLLVRAPFKATGIIVRNDLWNLLSGNPWKWNDFLKTYFNLFFSKPSRPRLTGRLKEFFIKYFPCSPPVKGEWGGLLF